MRSFSPKSFQLLLLFLLPFAGAGTNGRLAAQSLRFEGKADRLLLRNSVNALSPDSFTIEAWVYSPHWRNGWFENTILSTEDRVTEDRKPRRGFAFAAGGRPGGAGQLGLMLYIRGAGKALVSPPCLATHRWYHVAAVVQQTKVWLYVDGREVRHSEVLPGYVPSEEPMQVGNTGGFEERGMNGAIDELRIWNKARSQAEIQRDRTTSLRGNEPGLLAYFPIQKEDGAIPKNKVSNAIEAEFQPSRGTAWAPGYSPIATDVGVEAIEGPDVFTARQGPRRVKLTLRNYGTQAVGTIPLVYRLDGREILRDTLRKPLDAGASTTHRTLVPLDCLPGDSSRLEVFTALPGDAWPRNDTARAQYRKPAPGSTRPVVTVFDNVLHDFGAGAVEWFQFRRVVLPEDNHRYSRILMHVSVACTPKGCDEWDRIGQIFLLKNGEQYELSRFITPYGVPCGPWTFDVTDFRSVLRGNCQLESFIHTFTLKGWRLTVSLEFIEGGPNPHPYHRLRPLWQTDELVYGDDRYSTRLPVVRIQPNPYTRVLTFHHTITGHGQGNTDGAGEFARKTHRLILKKEGQPDSTVIPHLLWRNDCAKNPCSGQKGSAMYSRAGWCPGQEVRPFTVNLPVHAGVLTLDYQIQPYKNLLVSAYNDGSHTESHFWLYSYLIEKSDSLRGFGAYTNVRCQRVELVGDRVRVWVVNSGTTPVSGLTLRSFVGGTFHAAETLAATLNPQEEKAFFLAKSLPARRPVGEVLAVLADLDGDENVNDDVATGKSP